MDYQVSAKIQGLFDQVTAIDEVKKGIEFIEKDQDQSISDQKALTLIESPTFHEETRAPPSAFPTSTPETTPASMPSFPRRP